MCYQTRDVIEAMSRDSGIQIREMKADGGAVSNGFLMQFQSDVLGVPVDVPRITETTGLGAAYLAGLATGQWTSKEEISSLNKISKRYEANMSVDVRNKLYENWLRAVERARGWIQE
jgi:glycerol kinase